MSNLSEVIERNKPHFTPMEEDESLLPYYRRTHQKTGKIMYPIQWGLGAANSNMPIRNTLELISNSISSFNDFFPSFTGAFEAPMQIQRANSIEKKYIEYYNDFIEKWKEFGLEFNSFDEVFVMEKFKEIVFELLSLNSEYITFIITDDESIFFQTKFKEYNVYLEMFFDKTYSDGIYVVTNIFKEKKPIIAIDGSINESIKSICKYLFPETHSNIVLISFPSIPFQTNPKTEL